jgi:hypothetical protein
MFSRETLICYLLSPKFLLASVCKQDEDSAGIPLQADFLFVDGDNLQGTTGERELAAPWTEAKR